MSDGVVCHDAGEGSGTTGVLVKDTCLKVEKTYMVVAEVLCCR